MSKSIKCVDGVELLEKEKKKTGPRGPTGPCCTGPTGAQGDTGATGPCCTGPTGATGSFDLCALVVPNLAALEAFEISGLDCECCLRVQVQTLGCAEFLLDCAGEQTIDGITVLGTSTGTGRWIRTTEDTPTWKYQPTWFIDPVAGGDENDGSTPATALETLAELSRRWGIGYPKLVGELSSIVGPPAIGPHFQVVVNIMNDVPGTDPLDFRVYLPENTLLAFVGATTLIRSGVITAVTPLSRSTNQAWEITDPAAPWAAEIGNRVTITSGPNVNRTFWIAREIAPGVARISAPNNTALHLLPDSLAAIGGSLGPVSPGDTYIVERLTQIRWADLDVRGPGYGASITTLVGFANLDISPSGTRFQITTSRNDGTVQASFKGCRFADHSLVPFGAGRHFFTNCTVWNRLIPFVGAQAVFSSQIFFFSGMSLNSAMYCGSSGYLSLDLDFLMQGSGFQAVPFPINTGGLVSGGGHITIGTTGIFDSAVAGLQIGGEFVSGAPGGEVWLTSALGGVHALYGLGNAGVGVAIGSGGQFGYTPLPPASLPLTGVPTVTGTAGDFSLGGAATARAFDELGLAGPPGVYGPALPTTLPAGASWATVLVPIPLGFSGSAHNVQQNAHLLNLADTPRL